VDSNIITSDAHSKAACAPSRSDTKEYSLSFSDVTILMFTDHASQYNLCN